MDRAHRTHGTADQTRRRSWRRRTAGVGVATALALSVGGVGMASTAQAADGYFRVWEHSGAGGAGCAWFGDDADYRYNTNCGNFNDRVSSLKNDGYPGAFEDVQIFEDTNYRGASICVPNGAYWSGMPAGWNDRVSSHKWVNAC